MKRAFANFLLMLALAVLCWTARAENSAPTFDSANKLYEEGKFADAAAAYEKVALSGQTSGPLYFNMGNAFLKAGQIGRAIAAYHQAEQIIPRDPDVRANLQFARRQISGPSVDPARWQRWLNRLTLNEWTLLTMAAGWILFLLLAAQQRWPAARVALRAYVIVVLLATLFLCACLGTAYYEARVVRYAIVASKDAVVRLGPVPESQEAFTAHDGAELQVLDQKDEWIAVSAGPGRFGWIRRDQVILSSPG